MEDIDVSNKNLLSSIDRKYLALLGYNIKLMVAGFMSKIGHAQLQTHYNLTMMHAEILIP